jgi:hypothetical protein
MRSSTEPLQGLRPRDGRAATTPRVQEIKYCFELLMVALRLVQSKASRYFHKDVEDILFGLST